MNVRKVIQRRIRERLGGIDVASDVNVVVAANVDRPRGAESTEQTTKKGATDGGEEEERAPADR